LSTGIGAVSGAFTAGIGTALGPPFAEGLKGFANIATGVGKELIRAGLHGVTQGILGGFSGQEFGQGFLIGAVSSMAGSMFQGVSPKFANSTAGMIGFSGVAGGVTAELTGGDFLKGFATGITIGALNHAMHSALGNGGDDPPEKRTQGKGNKLRGGSQKQRDADLNKYPKEFGEWYHKNTKDYKLPGQPDPNLDEPYNDWLGLGKPKAFSPPKPYYKTQSSENIQKGFETGAKVAVGVGIGATILKYGEQFLNIISRRLVMPILYHQDIYLNNKINIGSKILFDSLKILSLHYKPIRVYIIFKYKFFLWQIYQLVEQILILMNF